MEDMNTRDLIKQLQTQIEAQAQTIREQQEIQGKQAVELAALRAQRPPPEVSASNRHEDNEGSHHGGPSEPAGGGRKGPTSVRLTNLLPFTEAIMQAHMPEKPPPMLERYDGSTDPDNHFRNFVDAMAFYTDNDPVICRAFSLSLKDEALEWYHTLPQNSVDCFATVEALFRKQYAANKRPEMTPAELLYADPPKSMEELQSTIAKFIRIEDLRNSRKKQQQDNPNQEAKKAPKRPANDFKTDRPPRKESGWISKYDRYTSLNAPRTKVLEEALHAELLTIRRKATPKNADNNKACRLHKNHDHDTEECHMVKDELERLIRAGYLQNYVKERTASRATTPHRKDSSR
ncbi:uncharacterized protein LOC108329115 [Vigna angularis]|uniref:uncharacterized protein LOC108329115 n=1 Tax=Phaseolus angularis TaxID=3914 RepID=UPI000809AEC4|nr:uncharacterized protein LOC108329115 [Vigna angularis]